MNKSDLLFYDAYEEFYKMAAGSPAFQAFCKDAFGEVDYEENSFDVITSMDTMYFAKDMSAFVAQVKKWLKKEGVFFVGYQEGDVMPRTESAETTVLAQALQQNGLPYEVTDITRQTYELLQKKREAALAHEKEFLEEQQKDWFDLLLFQTDCATENYEEFAGQMARYLFVARKE